MSNIIGDGGIFWQLGVETCCNNHAGIHGKYEIVAYLADTEQPKLPFLRSIHPLFGS